MPPKTRQQRRARSRSPLKKKGKGARTFMLFMMIVLFGGIGLIYLARSNPPPLTRGATAGEHWHASLKMFICGQQVTNYPTVEGALHSHGDGFIHIHPHDATNSGDLASLGSYLGLYETSVREEKGKRVLTLPGRPKPTTYADGDDCGKKDKKKYNVVVTNKGKEIEGDPSAFLPHDGDAIEIRFGPKPKKGSKLMLNPYSVANGIPDVGLGGDKPAPDGGPPPEGDVPTDPESSGRPDDSAEPTSEPKSTEPKSTSKP